jgi:hypothetical protein
MAPRFATSALLNIAIRERRRCADEQELIPTEKAKRKRTFPALSPSSCRSQSLRNHFWSLWFNRAAGKYLPSINRVV